LRSLDPSNLRAANSVQTMWVAAKGQWLLAKKMTNDGELL